MKLSELSVLAFTERVASCDPAPGGGSCAALYGCLGAALTAMVGGMTQNRKKYAEYEEHAKEVEAKCGMLREKLADVEYRNLSNITKGYVSFYDGDARLYGILDASGQVVSEPAFNMIGNVVGGHYVKVTVNEAEGLYDLDARAMAVPATYQRIYTWGDKAPINDGYVCVEQDGKLGFIDLEGNVTCPIQYAKDSVSYYPSQEQY